MEKIKCKECEFFKEIEEVKTEKIGLCTLLDAIKECIAYTTWDCITFENQHCEIIEEIIIHKKN